MACTSSITIVNGFSFEVSEANISLVVVNTFGDLIDFADVRLITPFETTNERTDIDGCVELFLPSGQKSNLVVDKECYHIYSSRIVAVENFEFDEGANFPFKIETENGTNVITATAQITYKKSGVPDEVVSVLLNTNGIFEGTIKEGFDNLLEINGGTQGSYTNQINVLLKNCKETGYKALPIIPIS